MSSALSIDIIHQCSLWVPQYNVLLILRWHLWKMYQLNFKIIVKNIELFTKHVWYLTNM